MENFTSSDSNNNIISEEGNFLFQFFFCFAYLFSIFLEYTYSEFLKYVEVSINEEPNKVLRFEESNWAMLIKSTLVAIRRHINIRIKIYQIQMYTNMKSDDLDFLQKIYLSKIVNNYIHKYNCITKILSILDGRSEFDVKLIDKLTQEICDSSLDFLPED